MPRIAQILLRAGLLALLIAAPRPCRAQPASTQQASLPDRQAAIRERVQRLEARMLQLAQLLAESEPQQAERLRDALDKTRQQRIERRLDQLVAALRAARFSDAEREQAAVTADLEAVLTLLTSPAGQLDERRREREQLEARRKAVRSLLDEQQQHLYRTELLKKNAALAEQLGKLADALEQLAQEQADLAQQNAAPAELAERQQKLEQQARAAQAELEKLAQEQSEQARAAAEQARTSLQGAQDAMRRAAQALEKSGDRAAAQTDQKFAEEDLRAAVRRLREERKAAAESADAKSAEEAQRGTQRRTRELQKEMQPAEGRRSPGAEQVEQAAQTMQQAADSMGEQQMPEAQDKQREAVGDLQQALDELEDALRQVRQEEQEETLAAVESRVRAILAREEDVLQTAIELDAKGAAKWQRADELRLAESAGNHAKALEDAQTLLRVLTEEGTTVIVPELIKQVIADMSEISVLLAKPDTGPMTRATLGDVVELLKEILGAVERKRDQNANAQNQPQPDSAQAPEQQPLLPRSAELRLLRSAHQRVMERTVAAAQPEGQADAGAYERLAARQRELAELARRIHERAE